MHTLYIFAKSARMKSGCNYCKHIDGTNHPESCCPFVNSLYCSNCAIYGHNNRLCPDAQPKYIRLLNNDSYIIQYLNRHSVSCKRIKGKKLREIIEKYAEEKGRIIRYIRCPFIQVNYHNPLL